MLLSMSTQQQTTHHFISPTYRPRPHYDTPSRPKNPLSEPPSVSPGLELRQHRNCAIPLSTVNDVFRPRMSWNDEDGSRYVQEKAKRWHRRADWVRPSSTECRSVDSRLQVSTHFPRSLRNNRKVMRITMGFVEYSSLP